MNRYNKGYYAGGYNRSRLPGQQRTRKRAIFFLNELQFKVKNKAQSQIRLKDSDQPVTMLRIQNPYLVAYCRPTIYVVSLCSH